MGGGERRREGGVRRQIQETYRFSSGQRQQLEEDLFARELSERSSTLTLPTSPTDRGYGEDVIAKH